MEVFPFCIINELNSPHDTIESKCIFLKIMTNLTKTKFRFSGLCVRECVSITGLTFGCSEWRGIIFNFPSPIRFSKNLNGKPELQNNLGERSTTTSKTSA